jgi:multisubunit Na+/H+ antiporter MnhG subunit
MLVVIAGTLGMALMRGAAARLHFVNAVSLVAPPLIMAAVLCDSGFSQAGVKTILIVIVLSLEGPVLAHVLGRAIFTHERVPETKKGASR